MSLPSNSMNLPPVLDTEGPKGQYKTMDFYGFNRAEIDLGVLESNYKRICEYAGGSKVMCVVKADAYAHGALRCAETLYRAGCRLFGVSCVNEAIEIRHCVGNSDILILGIVPEAGVPLLCENNIIVALASAEEARRLAAAVPEGKRLRVHVKLDTGMNRIGFAANEKGVDEIEKALSCGKFSAEGLFTHFACADEPSSDMTRQQFDRFKKCEKLLSDRGIVFGCRHVCNSAATMLDPEMHLDAVRAGIILYGLDPSPEARASGLKPVMSLKTKITHIHSIEPGEKVGYGATFTAEYPMIVATLPIGYYDGFIRAYANGTGVPFGGKDCPIVGRICMDQCMIDVTGTDAKVGDPVELFGAEHSVERFSDAANTIPYESLCLISKRVERVYTGL